MATTLAEKLTALALENGWTNSYQRAFQESVWDDKGRTRIDFVRGFDSVRLVFTKSGASVDLIWLRWGAFGDVREYHWQPDGAKARRALAEEVLKTGKIKDGNWSYAR